MRSSVSIGLDSGCVYGRRLSALVVPIGNGSSTTTSPLGKALIAPPNSKLDATAFTQTESSSTLVGSSGFESESKQVADSTREEEEEAEEEDEASGATSVRASAAAAAVAARPNSQPNWHGGLNRVKLSPPGSAIVAAVDNDQNSDSVSEEEPNYIEPTSGAAEENDEEEKKETRPWWRPWLRKRAPPQGRPGIAPWESATDERTAVSSASRTTRPSSSSFSSAPTTTTTTTTKTGVEGGSRSLKKLHTSPSTTSTLRKQNAAAHQEDDEDEEDPRMAPSAAATGLEEGDKEASSSNHLREQQVVLAQAREINNAWIVSVDCSGELAYQN